MADAIVTKRKNTPAPQQKRIAPALIERAMGNGLNVAHDCLSCLLDIGENYAQSSFSTETMRAVILQFSGDASNSADCGIEEIRNLGIAESAVKEVALSIETSQRLHDFFYKDHGEHLQAMEPEIIGNLTLGMVRPALTHLERGVKLLGYDGGGFDSITDQYGNPVTDEYEPAVVTHETEAAGGVAVPGKYDQAAKILIGAHGSIHALHDLAREMDVWPCSIFTLGSSLMPLAEDVDSKLSKIEDALPRDGEGLLDSTTGTAGAEILKAMEYAEALSFLSKHFIYSGSTEYDNTDWDEKQESEFHKDYTKERLLSCFGGSVGALVYRIAHHMDNAARAIGAGSSVIELN